MNIFLSASAPENLVSRDGFGSPVSRQPALISLLRLNMVLTYFSEFLPSSATAYINLFNHQNTPSGQSRVYRVTQSLRIDGVHCRESAAQG